MSQQTWNPPQLPTTGGQQTQPNRPRRPKFGLVAVAAIGLRFGREILEWVARGRFGFVGIVGIALLGFAIVMGWRSMMIRKRRTNGGVEVTPEGVRQQVVDSGLAGPAFAGDGTLLGSSILVMNQQTKLMEVNTAYDLFDEQGRLVGAVRQIGQSRLRQAVRIFTAFDQLMTHHFNVTDASGTIVLRMTRPRKIFKTKVHVYNGHDQYLGSILQQNVFGKIRFALVDAAGNTHGMLKAEKLHAWDFQLSDAAGHNTATVIKSWEGWARTTFTRADRYVIRIHRQLPSPVRELTVACALSIDLALKQDSRSFG